MNSNEHLTREIENHPLVSNLIAAPESFLRDESEGDVLETVDVGDWTHSSPRTKRPLHILKNVEVVPNFAKDEVKIRKNQLLDGNLKKMEQLFKKTVKLDEKGIHEVHRLGLHSQYVRRNIEIEASN